MKLSTKIMISSLAVLLISTPAFNTLLNSTPADQVVHASSSTVIKLSSTGKVPIFNSKGNQLNGQFLKGGEVITSYGKPVIIRHKYQRSGIFPTVKIDGKSYTSLGDGGYILVNHTGGYTAKGMRIVSNATVYNEKGKKLSTYRGKHTVLLKGSTIKYGGAKNYSIASSYFKVGQGRYVRDGYVQKMSGKPLLILNHNTYVYDKQGKRVSYEGKRKLLNNSVVTTSSKIRAAKSVDKNYFYQSTNIKNKNKLTFTTTKIRRQNCVAIGRNKYIKINNLRTANGMILFTKGPITVTLTNSRAVYDANFKKTE